MKNNFLEIQMILEKDVFHVGEMEYNLSLNGISLCLVEVFMHPLGALLLEY
jgi:hypothetical protein